MTKFAPALRRAARELDLPPALRAPILLEMAADLEAAYEHHRSRGAGEAEAVRQAEQSVLGSAEVLRRLGRIHRRSWRGWSEGAASLLSDRVNAALLLGGVAPMFLLAAAVAVRGMGTSGPSGWAVVGLGLAIAALIAVEAGRIVGGGRGGAGGLPLLLLLSVVAPVAGALVLALELHAVATALAGGIPEAAGQVALLERAGAAGTVLAAGLALGIAGALSWFLLTRRVSVAAARQVDSLLRGDAGASPAMEAGKIVPLTTRRQR